MASYQSYNTCTAASFNAGKGFNVDPRSGGASPLGFPDRKQLTKDSLRGCVAVVVLFIVTVLFWGSVAFVLFIAPDVLMFFPFPVFFYIVQLVGVYLVSRLLCLNNTMTRTEAHQAMQSWHTAQPEIIMQMECFHYATETTYDSDGKTTTSTSRIVTHAAAQRFHYDRCEDASSDIPYLRSGLTELRTYGELLFADRSSLEVFNSEAEPFVRANTRDQCQVFDVRVVIPDFESRSLVTADSGPPCWLRMPVYVLFGLLTLGPLYSLCVSLASRHAQHTVRKRITCAIRV